MSDAPSTPGLAAAEPAYELNGRPVSREAFYAVACDPRRSVAVEACAGAGKTWMLVSRILRALLDGADGADRQQRRPAEPHEILAITFTRKAAGEMRARLHDWLAEFARATPEQLQQELISRGISPMSASSGHLLLQNLYQSVLSSGRPVQIRTFHSWFAALLRTAPLAVLQSLGLPVAYELLEDDQEAVARVWRRYFSAVATDPVLRADFEDLVAVSGRSQARKALAQALEKRVEFSLADARGVVDASVRSFQALCPEFAGLAAPADALAGEAARLRWLARARALGSETLKTPQKAADAVVEAFAREDPAARLDALRKAFFVRDEDRLTKHLQKYDPACEAEAELQRLCLAQRQHEAWLHQQRLARLTRRLLQEFAALKRERGWVDMNDVERAAQVMLSDPVLSGWMQERLDARVKHLLIDEFQDTNPLQWQALHAWLSGYVGAGDDAPGVFIVGDPKQSIYRFRRAEPQVFRAAQAFVRDGLGGDLLACDHTRRNAPAVIEAVNATMGAAQAAGEYGGFRAHTTESRAAGALLRLPQIPRPANAAGDEAVEGADGVATAAVAGSAVWRDSLTTPRVEPEETLRKVECRQAARWVAGRLAEGARASEVMVLARKRDRLSALQDELRHLGIPTEQPEKSDLAAAPEVQDVVALVDALVSPAHDLSLARALRSPLFGIDDTDLARLAQLRRRPQLAALSWLDLLQRAGEPAAEGSGEPGGDLRGEISVELAGCGPRLAQYQAWLAALPPHDALQAIYDHGDVLARYAGAAPAPQRERVLANLRAVLGASLQIDGARYLTPYALVRAFRQGRLRAPVRAGAEAVRLLTVHGAKGLEADDVLLLDTDTRAPPADTMGVLVDWPGEQPAPRRFVFLASESRPPPCAQDALAAEVAERQREELNALYVAMTRARRQLVLSSVQPHGAAEGSWWSRLAPLARELLPPGVEADAVAAPAAASGGAVCVPVLPNVLVKRSSSATEFIVPAAATTPVSRLGEAMHRLLEQAGHGVTDWTAQRLAQLAREFEITPGAAREAAGLARRILAGEGSWAWDPAAVDWQGDEVELLLDGQRLRLDRLVRHRTRGWWVLDYKSAAAPERQGELVAQLQRYRRAVQAACPGEPVTAAFLTGDGRLVEVTGEAGA